MQIVLEVPQNLDINWLLQLFQQLNLRVVQKIDTPTSGLAAPSSDGLSTVDAWAATVKPMRQSQSIEDMVAEQNYKGMDMARMDSIIESLGVQEPVETLLAQLTK